MKDVNQFCATYINKEKTSYAAAAGLAKLANARKCGRPDTGAGFGARLDASDPQNLNYLLFTNGAGLELHHCLMTIETKFDSRQLAEDSMKAGVISAGLGMMFGFGPELMGQFILHGIYQAQIVGLGQIAPLYIPEWKTNAAIRVVPCDSWRIPFANAMTVSLWSDELYVPSMSVTNFAQLQAALWARQQLAIEQGKARAMQPYLDAVRAQLLESQRHGWVPFGRYFRGGSSGSSINGR